jgi:hypothetical protein
MKMGFIGSGGVSSSVRRHRRLRRGGGETKMVFDTIGGGGEGRDGGSSVGVGVGVVGRGSKSTGGGGSRHWSIVVNATILLPISEGTFVGADNPLLARY